MNPNSALNLNDGSMNWWDRWAKAKVWQWHGPASGNESFQPGRRREVKAACAKRPEMVVPS
jgi:hypothetical protein